MNAHCGYRQSTPPPPPKKKVNHQHADNGRVALASSGDSNPKLLVRVPHPPNGEVRARAAGAPRRPLLAFRFGAGFIRRLARPRLLYGGHK